MPLMSEKELIQFEAKEIRDLLKSKAHCLRAGFAPNDVIIQTLNDIRCHYINQVGLKTYLSQMLGNLATKPVRLCKLYHEDGRLIELYLNGNHAQPVQRFIVQHFSLDRLPFKVEFTNPHQPDTPEMRYL